MSKVPTPTYWQSLSDLEPAGDRCAEKDPGHPHDAPAGSSPSEEPRKIDRRGFFRVMGLSGAAFTAASCKRAPVTKLLPFVQHPEEVTPGVASWYATTCAACEAGCGLLVKSRDGRPIKIEGNPQHPWSQGGACAVGQASVLSAYDADRAKKPRSRSKTTTWDALDAEVTSGLARVAASGRVLRVVTAPRLGPSEEKALGALLARYPGAKRVVFAALGEDAIALAHRATHGTAAVPSYHFDAAHVIASFAADFLGTWLSPVAFTRRYAQGRAYSMPHAMSRHWQLEPHLSLTGTNADRRIPLRPSDERRALLALARRLAIKGGFAGKEELAPALEAPEPSVDARSLDELSEDLWRERGRALVISGSDDVATQVAVNVVNHVLGNYVTTLDLSTPLWRDAGAMPFGDLLGELEKGEVGALVFYGVNPVYAHPAGAALADLLPKVELTVAVADRADETARLCQHLAPAHHFLESWGDAEPVGGVLSVLQPLVRPLFTTRAAPESLLRWAGDRTDWLAFLKSRWEREVFPRAVKRPLLFQSFWDDAVHDGFARVEVTRADGTFLPGPAASALAAAPARAAKGLELWLYAPVALRDGRMANNGWLQELPDPVSKVTWGNYAAVSPARARRLGLKDGDVVALEVGGRKLELPVLAQPGTHDHVVAVALGYGRTRAGRIGNGVGVGAFALAPTLAGRARLWAAGATLAATGRRDPLALSQVESSQHGRGLVREVTLEGLRGNPRLGEDEGQKPLSLWPEHEYQGHRWGMAIDLTACTGCSACVVSCQAENNIVIVGKDEVRRRREMHWLRIDRYYEGPPENPRAVHQPMPCLHCENAPCETVCPVLATVHSTEGLNQQVYARCVGTRYCANNCPTKTRRFNWFEYDRSDALANMVLNPDVTVRSRGVMEKCSLCVQRIQEGKAQARAEGRALWDGEIRTACEQSCPAGAIVFGDLNDPNSRLTHIARSGRSYTILSELNIKPRVRYLGKVRNPGHRSGA
jgi:molybdopterin-containing oxidoreductase family iron-sulfur binding subunit